MPHAAALSQVRIRPARVTWDEVPSSRDWGTAPLEACPLHDAVRQGNETATVAALGMGVDPNSVAPSCGLSLIVRNQFWLTLCVLVCLSAALHFAAAFGHCDLIRLLAARGAQLNAPSRDLGWAPLHAACEWGRTEAVRLFVEQLGAAHSPAAADCTTPLALAGRYRSRGVLARILFDFHVRCTLSRRRA